MGEEDDVRVGDLWCYDGDSRWALVLVSEVPSPGLGAMGRIVCHGFQSSVSYCDGQCGRLLRWSLGRARVGVEVRHGVWTRVSVGP